MANNSKKKNIFVLILIFSLLILVVIYNLYVINEKINYRKASAYISQDANLIPEIPNDNLASIVAIGDTLCHSQNFKDAYDNTSQIYDFSPMFKYVTKYFEDATVAVGN